MKTYGFNGLAGCVTQSKSRTTGTLVGLYHGAQSGLESDPDLPWVTVCEEHSTLVGHATLKTARGWLPDPCGWCDECRDKGACAEPTVSLSLSVSGRWVVRRSERIMRKVSVTGVCETADTCGTCRMGTVYASVGDLMAALGDPTHSAWGEDVKVTAEWTFETPYGAGSLHDYWWNASTEWSVGAANHATAAAILGYVSACLGRDVGSKVAAAA